MQCIRYSLGEIKDVYKRQISSCDWQIYRRIFMRNRKSWTWSSAKNYLADKINTASEIVAQERRKSKCKDLIILCLAISVVLLVKAKEKWGGSDLITRKIAKGIALFVIFVVCLVYFSFISRAADRDYYTCLLYTSRHALPRRGDQWGIKDARAQKTGNDTNLREDE